MTSVEGCKGEGFLGRMAAASILQRSITVASGVLKSSSTFLVPRPKSEEMPLAADEPLQAVLDTNRAELERASHLDASKQWLKPHLETREGTEEIYSMMEQHVDQPAFLKKLEAAQESKRRPAAARHGDEVMHEEWWETPAVGTDPPEDAKNEEFTQVSRAEVPEMEPIETYVIVQKEDVLEAIGTFVAAYLAELPEAQNLQPAQLQAALKTAFKELRKGRVRRLWEWGRAIYRITAFSYGAFSVYENPWLVRAVLAALWTACRMLVGAGIGVIL